MNIIAFIAHPDAYLPPEWEPRLAADLRTLARHETTLYCVGSEGSFNRAVHRILEELASQSDDIQFAVVLSSFPTSAASRKRLPPHADIIIPAGIESVPPRQRILKCNEWMIRQADILITCTEDALSHSDPSMEYTGKQSRIVLNLPHFYSERGK